MKNFPALPRLIVLLVIISAFISCNKESDILGLNLVPESDLLSMGYTDTTTLVTYTVMEDSLTTSALSYIMVGSINDPVFGRTNATWYGIIKPATTSFKYGANPVFDSAFLILPYRSVFGDTLNNFTIKVYEVTQTIPDTAYSNQQVTYDSNNPLAEYTFVPRPGDSVFYGGKMNAPALRIPLNGRFAQRLFQADTTELTDSTFADYFKGICLAAEPQTIPGKGAILQLYAPGTGTLQFYYHNDSDTVKYNFYVPSSGKRFIHYDHFGYQDAAYALKQQLAGDTAMGRQFLFIQSMAGLKVKIKFPTLPDWFKSGKVIVNDAQLIITNALPSGNFKQPASLSLRSVEADGSTGTDYIIDQSSGTEAYFDGTYNSASQTYRFRISRYVQQLMLGNGKKYGLYLTIPNASLTATRLALNGPGHPQSSLKLYIKYTRLD